MIKMKRLIILLVFSLGWWAGQAATYYVSVSGVNDPARNGSSSQPWASLSYAAGRVTTAGDLIYVNSGNYTDNNRVALSVGVSIQGNIILWPVITTSYVASSTIDGYLYLNSPSGNAINGNQTISYIRFTGNGTVATRAGSVNFRGNVKIHHCSFSDFLYSGMRFYGSNSSYNVTPTNTLPQGNEVYDCTFNNCSQRVGSNTGGHIRSDCQRGLSIHHNTFTQNSRPVGYNGNTFSGYQNFGLQVHDNVFTKPDNNYTESLDNGYTWNFFMEFHFSHGGIDIYNNEFIGVACVDFAGTEKGEYDYGGRVYDNIFRSASGGFAPYNPHNEPYLDLESFSYVNYVDVFRNKFSYGRIAIALNNITTSSTNVNIYDNIIENTGNSDNSWDNAIYISSHWAEVDPITITNVNIYHNVITAGKTTLSGINVNAVGTITNINIRNNIIYGAFSRPIRFTAPSAVTVNTVNINNNIFYGNSNTTIYYDTDINYVNRNDSGNLAGSAYNPLFVGGNPFSYALSGTASPAYHAGYSVGIATDYYSNLFASPNPSIGAIEYGSETEPEPDPEPEPGETKAGLWNGNRGMYNGKAGKW